MRPFPSGETNRLLGYPPDARLLIIHAGGFGMCHATNAAICRTLTAGLVRSATLMVPCPWALHALHWLQAHPQVPFGVHLTGPLRRGRLSLGAAHSPGPRTLPDRGGGPRGHRARGDRPAELRPAASGVASASAAGVSRSADQNVRPAQGGRL